MGREVSRRPKYDIVDIDNIPICFREHILCIHTDNTITHTKR